MENQQEMIIGPLCYTTVLSSVLGSFFCFINHSLTKSLECACCGLVASVAAFRSAAESCCSSKFPLFRPPMAVQCDRRRAARPSAAARALPAYQTVKGYPRADIPEGIATTPKIDRAIVFPAGHLAHERHHGHRGRPPRPAGPAAARRRPPSPPFSLPAFPHAPRSHRNHAPGATRLRAAARVRSDTALPRRPPALNRARAPCWRFFSGPPPPPPNASAHDDAAAGRRFPRRGRRDGRARMRGP